MAHADRLPLLSAASPSRRILVIEDDRHVRRLLGDLLDAWGYRVDVAADGAEGLARFHPGVHDMVLTDFAMPSLSGVEVIEAVRDRDRGVAVVMLTSSTRDLDRDGQRLRFRLVRKPLDIDTLRRVVSDSLVVPRPF